MSPAERRLYLRIQRRASGLTPDLARDLLDAYETIRAALSPVEIERAIESGQLDRIIDDALLDRSLLPYRLELQRAVEKGFEANTQDLPRAGKIDGATAVLFDRLNPRVIDGVRALDTRVVNTLKVEIRETVRAHVENGLRDGKNPRAIARDLRQVIGLAPNQEEAVRNLRRELEAGRYAIARQRKLLDRRFNLDNLDALSESQRTERIDKIVERYRKDFTAWNAETNSRTATLDSLKLGQKLSWDDAIAKGVVDPNRLWKRWVATLDSRLRDEHRAMHGEEVKHDAYYSNGEMVPGESTYNCRCVSLYFLKREAAAIAA